MKSSIGIIPFKNQNSIQVGTYYKQDRYTLENNETIKLLKYIQEFNEIESFSKTYLKVDMYIFKYNKCCYIK